MKSLNNFKLITITIGVLLGLALSGCANDWPDLPIPGREIYPPDGESSTIIDTANVVHFGEVDFIEYDELPVGSFPNKNNYFTSDARPSIFLNEWVSKKYNEVTAGSTIKLNFDYLNLDLPDSVLFTRQALTKFSQRDYKLKWGQGNPFVYTPSTDINSEVNKVLNANYGQTDPDNPYRVVNYNYSNEEPTVEADKPFNVYKEYFEFVADINIYNNTYWNKWLDEKHKPKGVILKKVSGTIAIWQPYSRGTVYGVFIRSKNTPGDSWFITPALDLTSGNDPVLRFRIGFGYSTGIENFELLVSTDFDGDADNILDATWKNHRDDVTVTGAATISDIKHSNSYATESNMHEILLDLSEYAASEHVYIAFRDHPGPEPENVSGLPFTVIDQISVESIRDFASVPESSIEPKIELYKNTGTNWKKQTSGYYILNKVDYDLLGAPYLGETEAINKLSTILANKINDAKENDIYTVIYKNSNVGVSNYQYMLKDGVWKVQNLDVERESISFELEYPYTWKVVE